MTAEIAIMNKKGIALATDSAATITMSNNDSKIYDTENKLFTLSKYQPVGIMVYGGAEFMDIPWETIIKLFREKIDKECFENLIDYKDEFIKFLESNNDIFPMEIQHNIFFSKVEFLFSNINNRIDSIIRNEINKIEEGEELTEEDIQEIVSTTIKDYCDNQIDNYKTLDNLSKYEEEKICDQDEYKEKVIEIKDSVFEKVPITDKSFNNLIKLVNNFFIKNNFLFGNSGIVIAGFGENEIFPSLVELKIGELFENNLKYDNIKEENISYSNRASIIPFAQSEMVHTFMMGIDTNQIEATTKFLQKVFYDQYPSFLIDNYDIEEDKTKELRKIGKNIIDSFNDNMMKYRREKYINKVVNAVSFLPKDELAEMAESLVHLTSFKRRVTLDKETVAGPIDVALITKGDGFVWIKRKHYFDPELNHHFFENYF